MDTVISTNKTHVDSTCTVFKCLGSPEGFPLCSGSLILTVLWLFDALLSLKINAIWIFQSRIQSHKDPGSKVKKILNPGSGSASKNLSIFSPKNFFKLSEIWYRMFIPDPRSGFFPWSRIPVSNKPKNLRKKLIDGFLKTTDEKSRIWIRTPVYESKDPDSSQNVKDPEHWVTFPYTYEYFMIVHLYVQYTPET